MNPLRLLLTSSNYKLCIGTAFLLELYYAYGVSIHGFHFGWSMTGMILFTWYEYMSHRFILHAVNDGTIYHYLHGNHHLRPYGKSIHVPILYTVTSVIGYWHIFALLVGNRIAAYNVMAMHQCCYIMFEHIHMEVHHPTWLITNDMFRVLHMYHHTRDKNKGYAFTTPTWDLLFGTFPHDVLKYNWFAYLPIPVLSFYLGTTTK